MAIFRISSNSNQHTNVGVSAFKKQISTCFQDWRRKSQQSEQAVPRELNFHRKSEKKKHFADKAHEKLKNLKKALHKFLKNSNKSEKAGPTNVEGGIRIAAELLAGAVITQTTTSCTTTTTTTKTTTVISAAAQEELSVRMAFIDEFTKVRDEHPQLDKVVRAILMTRAKGKGATIAEIKNDYLKSEGEKFPIYDNVISFLLSIPKVTAYCDSQGTLYFSILPDEKTQHLYKLITERHQSDNPVARSPNQPQQPEKRSVKRTPVRNWHTAYNIESAKAVARTMRGWRPMHIRALAQTTPVRPTDSDSDSERATSTSKRMRVGASSQYVDPRQNQSGEYGRPAHQAFPPIIAARSDTQTATEESPARTGSTGSDVHRNENNAYQNLDENNKNDGEYYRDNCHYLFGRIFSRQSTQRVVTIDCNNNTSIGHAPNLAIVNRAPTPGRPQQEQQTQQLVRCSVSKAPLQDKILNQILPMRQLFDKEPNLAPYSTSSETSETIYSEDSDSEAHLLDFALMGDDFLLHLARNELGCRFTKNKRVLQSGFCISGQTIRQAIKKVRQLPSSTKRFIINLGSVDIMIGRPLIQVQHDFRQLINIMHRKGFQLTLTTLAPLASNNYPHTKKTIERFNEFIKELGRFLRVIDIWSCFVDKYNRVYFDCFQREARLVTGTYHPHTFWNNIGRQRVLKLIEENLEY